MDLHNDQPSEYFVQDENEELGHLSISIIQQPCKAMFLVWGLLSDTIVICRTSHDRGITCLSDMNLGVLSFATRHARICWESEVARRTSSPASGARPGTVTFLPGSAGASCASYASSFVWGAAAAARASSTRLACFSALFFVTGCPKSFGGSFRGIWKEPHPEGFLFEDDDSFAKDNYVSAGIA